MLKISKLTKRFGNQAAVNELDIEVKEPGLYVFVGANGSGKSTLFNLVAGFILPDKGEICINGDSNTDTSRTKTGISTEPFFTEPSLTVNEIFDICIRIQKALFDDCEKWLSYWELDAFRNKSFKALSTGMKKRLSLALSLIADPDILLWDEPFNGLDPLGIELLNRLISDLVKQGKYVFLSTHLLNEIHSQEAVFFILKDGKLIGKIDARQIVPDCNEQIINLLK